MLLCKESAENSPHITMQRITTFESSIGGVAGVETESGTLSVTLLLLLLHTSLFQLTPAFGYYGYTTYDALFMVKAKNRQRYQLLSMEQVRI